jgi:hypothetical protein
VIQQAQGEGLGETDAGQAAYQHGDPPRHPGTTFGLFDSSPTYTPGDGGDDFGIRELPSIAAGALEHDQDLCSRRTGSM